MTIENKFSKEELISTGEVTRKWYASLPTIEKTKLNKSLEKFQYWTNGEYQVSKLS